MHRLLLIDHDRDVAQALGLACLERGAGVTFAENVCEGVRVLVDQSISLVVVDAALLRLAPHEHATLFDRVAPRTPVVVVVGPTTSLESRVALELAGFRVRARPVAADDLLKVAAGATA